ncbi:alpha-1,6-mannosyltransferase/alpha-1,6-mannosyltransferase [Propionibacterium cyclohexanicum]|uniref:Alpha-1,6-mannosyltransferase/alpha-1,6-mannosyltransferase n=2 Tax=Propionibacterium cyclohexanicum TaxID=64702 RepID=A0A1H9TA53_9ACTN|nr:alpha-1,6-mannosyltransferase/alpha-1,6-mannosyltransferase [Propionibacterium cyclohexanicum]
MRDWSSARWSDLGHALRIAAVRRGLIGTMLIALGTISPAYLPRNSPWWTLLSSWRIEGAPAKIAGTVVTMGGLLLLMDAWFRLRPRHMRPDSAPGLQVYSDVKHWAVLALWSLPFLLAPPIFSGDAYSYAAQGWLVHNGINPYYYGPGVLPGAFADQVSWVWRNTPSPYGPLSMQISNLLLHVFGFDPYLSAVAQRIPAVVGVVLIAVFLPRIAVRLDIDPAFTAWFGTLNPLLIIDFVGGAHNDSLMMGLVVLGLWVATTPVRGGPVTTGGRWSAGGWWWLAAAAVIGLAATIKQPALLAAYVVPLISRRWSSLRVRETVITVTRVLVSFVVAGGVFALVSMATGLDFGWYNAVSVPGSVVTPAPASLFGQLVQAVLGFFELDPTGRAGVAFAHTLFLVIGGVVLTIGAVTIARRRPMAFISWGYLVVVLASPALHSWYMLWGGLALPLARPSARTVTIAIWVNVSLLGYDAIDMAWRNNGAAIAVAAVAASIFMTYHHQSVIKMPPREPGSAAHLVLAARQDQ